MTRAARSTPARFDAGSQRRRAMLAKVHIAKKTLGLADDDYRQILLGVTTRTSASQCDDRELDTLIKHFESKGFSAKARPKGARPADHPAAKKARALWISLGMLGAISDPSEHALEAFARRQLGCTQVAWADQGQIYKLVEALKAIAERAGWSQTTKGVTASALPVALKRRLVDLLLLRLQAAGLAPADWRIERAAFEFAGLEMKGGILFASASTLETLAGAFAAKLKEVTR